MNGIVYRATNTVNKKAYIGKTTGTLERRKIEHKCAAVNEKYISLFLRSIKKYGWDVFEWDILFECSDILLLHKTEKHYIKKYGTLNIAQGGSGGDTMSSHPNKKQIYSNRKKREIRNLIILTEKQERDIISHWESMEVQWLNGISADTGYSSYICKRVLLKHGCVLPAAGVSRKTLLSRGLIVPSRKVDFTVEQIEDIINLYVNDKLSSTEIAKTAGLKSGDAIIKVLREQNVAIRSRGENTTIANLKRSKNGKYNTK